MDQGCWAAGSGGPRACVTTSNRVYRWARSRVNKKVYRRVGFAGEGCWAAGSGSVQGCLRVCEKAGVRKRVYSRVYRRLQAPPPCTEEAPNHTTRKGLALWWSVSRRNCMRSASSMLCACHPTPHLQWCTGKPHRPPSVMCDITHRRSCAGCSGGQ